MKKKDIQNRDDIFLLVSSFYKKVRVDTTLGPFFNNTITEWEAHLQLLTTFWETSLFMSKKLEHKYTGDPLNAHVKVDQQHHNSISELHFGLWLNLWFQTLDELFEAITLIQTHKIGKFPIILVGSEFWTGLMDWVKSTMLKIIKI